MGGIVGISRGIITETNIGVVDGIALSGAVDIIEDVAVCI